MPVTPKWKTTDLMGSVSEKYVCISCVFQNFDIHVVALNVRQLLLLALAKREIRPCFGRAGAG